MTKPTPKDLYNAVESLKRYSKSRDKLEPAERRPKQRPNQVKRKKRACPKNTDTDPTLSETVHSLKDSMELLNLSLKDALQVWKDVAGLYRDQHQDNCHCKACAEYRRLTR